LTLFSGYISFVQPLVQLLAIGSIAAGFSHIALMDFNGGQSPGF
jgi:hypothetical protein